MFVYVKNVYEKKFYFFCLTIALNIYIYIRIYPWRDSCFSVKKPGTRATFTQYLSIDEKNYNLTNFFVEEESIVRVSNLRNLEQD